MDVPLDVLAPAHDKASAKASNDIWISRALEAEVYVAVLLPDNSYARVKAESDLVPETNSFGWVDFGLREALYDLHHVLNDGLIGHAPGDNRG